MVTGVMQPMNRSILILILSILLFIPVIADIPIEGMKQHNYQYVINNSAEYPDFIFLTSSEIWNFEHPSIVVNGTFGGGYKLDGFVLHAIKEADLDPLVKEQLGTENQDKTDLNGYFSSAPHATADMMLPVATSINDTIPLSNLTVLLQIQNIQDNELNISKTRVIYGFENGTTIDMAFQEESDDSKPGTPGT
ncbi:MAG: hypothetical protein CVV33_01370 [Methanomicrobiales archaeon HGW-Methanomicrobiales-4]|nr:MAG: hypothetical protein CVV33_01370 [Methanomicrobiales archaeon HGW-Methanomicrobiales-4]